ncbi:insulinase family protein [Patescibacteria group bacterium]|nr:insulinase family protein [Patescibacteria group bacterium]
MQHKITKHHLANGISLVMIPLESATSVTTIALMGVGSRYESDQQRGIAHFTEHMVFKGGRKYTTAQQVAQALDAVGGDFNAFTSQEFTGFFTKTAGQHLELGIDVLSDIMLHATFPEVELEKEKGVIIEEINMYEDMPMRKVDQVLNSQVYGDTGMGRPILGNKESIASYARQDFLNYRKQFYRGVQCTVVIAGNFDPRQATKWVEQYFAELPAGEPYQPAPAVFHTDTPRVVIEEKASEQTHLMLAAKGYPLDHPKRHAYRLLATILGGNMSSRLFVSVREEQGLCYYVRAGIDAYQDTGMLVASAGVDNFRLNLAVAAIMQEFAKIKNEPVTAQELERAKQFSVGKLLLSLEDSEEVAEYYGMQDLLLKRIETPEEIEAATLAVTAAEVQDVARELLTEDNLRLAVIGPHQDQMALDQLLKLS